MMNPHGQGRLAYFEGGKFHFPLNQDTLFGRLANLPAFLLLEEIPPEA